MAKTTFSVNDTIAQFVEKMNTVSENAGDNMKSSFAPGKNIVDQINILRNRVSGFDDSAEIVRAFQQNLIVKQANGTYGNIEYDSATGTIDYTPTVDSNYWRRFSTSGPTFFVDGQLLIDSNINPSAITDETITISKYSNVVTFKIFDSAGNTLYNFKSPGI